MTPMGDRRWDSQCYLRAGSALAPHPRVRKKARSCGVKTPKRSAKERSSGTSKNRSVTLSLCFDLSIAMDSLFIKAPRPVSHPF